MKDRVHFILSCEKEGALPALFHTSSRMKSACLGMPEVLGSSLPLRDLLESTWLSDVLPYLGYFHKEKVSEIKTTAFPTLT